MKNKLKAICLSKTNILSVSFSILLFLKDVKEVITGFASHLLIIGLSIFILIGLLLINMFITKSKENKIENTEREKNEILNQKENFAGSNPQSKKNKLVFAKVVFAIVLFISLMTIGSLYYIKNMGVYYVVLESNLTKTEALNLMKLTNNSSEFSSKGLSLRVLELQNDNYELILRNGYINESHADSDLEKLKSLQLTFKPYKVGPQKVANYFKKIKYLQNDIFN